MTSDPIVLREVWARVQDRLLALPGVIAASASNQGVLNGSMPVNVPATQGMRVAGRPPRAPTTTPSFRSFIAPRFFETMGIPMVAGREFTDFDSDARPPVVILNETLARHHFGDENPIGRQVGFGPPATGTPETVIGVVRDFEAGTPRAVGVRQFRTYYPFRDRESQRRLAVMMVAVRTAGDPHLMIPRVADALAKAEPRLPVLKIDTSAEQLADVLAQDRLIAGLVAFFGMLAVLLACLGLYGVIAYTAERRTNEIGIRIALGASRVEVRRMVLRESVALAVAGAAIGIPAALLGLRVLSSRLYGISAADPPTIAAATSVLLALAALAGFLPARRASDVDPMVALRAE